MINSVIGHSHFIGPSNMVTTGSNLMFLEIQLRFKLIFKAEKSLGKMRMFKKIDFDIPEVNRLIVNSIIMNGAFVKGSILLSTKRYILQNKRMLMYVLLMSSIGPQVRNVLDQW